MIVFRKLLIFQKVQFYSSTLVGKKVREGFFRLLRLLQFTIDLTGNAFISIDHQSDPFSKLYGFDPTPGNKGESESIACAIATDGIHVGNCT